MKVKKAFNQISLPAPAKINLFLAITAKRADGYHEINSVLSSISLSDQVTILKTDTVNEISCICEGDNTLSGSDNLVCHAIEEWRKNTGDQTGVKIKILKKIPKMAGLGGGSSDAVSTLRGINLLHGEPLKDYELLEIAKSIGSDCSFFLSHGLSQVTGRGEEIREIDSPIKSDLKGQRIFLFQPTIGFSTPQLYKTFANKALFSDTKWAAERIMKWEKRSISTSEFLYNDFESVILQKYLFLMPLFDGIELNFGIKCNISGSGSCCYCFVPDNFDKIRVENFIKQTIGVGTRFWTCRIDFD